jgi:hypothetical protein
MGMRRDAASPRVACEAARGLAADAECYLVTVRVFLAEVDPA